jgi:hypothetical protein
LAMARNRVEVAIQQLKKGKGKQNERIIQFKDN